MMRLVSFVLLTTLAQATLTHAEPLFEYSGKKYSENDLPPATKQNLFEADQLRYDNYQQIADYSLIEIYIEEQVTKTKKPREAVEKEIFKDQGVTEAQAKEWFEQNKARLGGRGFDLLKPEIMQLLQRQAQDKSKEDLLVKLKNNGKYNFLLVPPKAPFIEIKTEGFPVKGNLNAKVTIVEFADYQCPHCQMANKTLNEVVEKYKANVKMTFLDFPINPSGISKVVAEGAVCADEQGKYWQYHDAAFNSQSKLAKESPELLAKEIGLNLDNFKKCLKTSKPVENVEKGRIEGQRIGVQGTPAIYINGKKHPGYSAESLSAAIEAAMKS